MCLPPRPPISMLNVFKPCGFPSICFVLRTFPHRAPATLKYGGEGASSSLYPSIILSFYSRGMHTHTQKQKLIIVSSTVSTYTRSGLYCCLWSYSCPCGSPRLCSCSLFSVLFLIWSISTVLLQYSRTSASRRPATVCSLCRKMLAYMMVGGPTGQLLDNYLTTT